MRQRHISEEPERKSRVSEKLLRNDMAAYKARAEAVRHAEVYRGAFAISVCPADNIESPTIVGAQAANELLILWELRHPLF